MEKVKKKRGVPPTVLIHYTEENYDEILKRLSEGETLLKICKSTHLPCRDAVYKRLIANPSFKERFDQAQTIRCGVIEDEIMEIADDTSHDDHPAAIYRANVKIRARQWLLTVHFPDKYGTSRQQIKHEGVQAMPTPVINISYDGGINAAKDGSDQPSITPEAEDSSRESSH